MSCGTLQNLSQIQMPDKANTHFRKGTSPCHSSPDGSRITSGMNTNEVFVLFGFSSKKLDVQNKQREIRCQIPPESPSAGLKTGIAPDSTADEGSFYSIYTTEIKASLRQFINRR